MYPVLGDTIESQLKGLASDQEKADGETKRKLTTKTIESLSTRFAAFQT